MQKPFISILLITLFMASITAPTLIYLVDDASDIVLLTDSSEEEEEKGSEKNTEFEIIVQNLTALTASSLLFENEENIPYCFKKYTIPHLNLIFPPPDFGVA